MGLAHARRSLCRDIGGASGRDSPVIAYSKGDDELDEMIG